MVTLLRLPDAPAPSVPRSVIGVSALSGVSGRPPAQFPLAAAAAVVLGSAGGSPRRRGWPRAFPSGTLRLIRPASSRWSRIRVWWTSWPLAVERSGDAVRYGFVIDQRKCIGCHACTVACKEENQVPLGVVPHLGEVLEKGDFPDTRRYFTVLRCNHCDDAPCVTICPTVALYRRPDGIVDFDGERCIGCKSCMQACPYDALYIDPETNTAAKCNYCAHRVEVGLEPACVVVCPEQAIIAGDLDDPRTRDRAARRPRAGAGAQARAGHAPEGLLPRRRRLRARPRMQSRSGSTCSRQAAGGRRPRAHGRRPCPDAAWRRRRRRALSAPVYDAPHPRGRGAGRCRRTCGRSRSRPAR